MKSKVMLLVVMGAMALSATAQNSNVGLTTKPPNAVVGPKSIKPKTASGAMASSSGVTTIVGANANKNGVPPHVIKVRPLAKK